MKFADIINDNPHHYDLLSMQQIADGCTQFIQECSAPLLKQLTIANDQMVNRIKVRHRTTKHPVESVMNLALSEQCFSKNVVSRGVFVRPNMLRETGTYYVFIPDGYKFMFSPEVTESTKQYQDTFHVIYENFDEPEAEQIVKDMFQRTYCQENLSEAINKGSEIMFYGIQHFFAVPSWRYQYDDLIQQIKSVTTKEIGILCQIHYK